MNPRKRKFINRSIVKTPDDLREQHESYITYLKSVEELMPEEAMAFASASFHYDFADRRCPHDAWLRSFKLLERTQDYRTVIDINIELLGAYHDGEITISYKDVVGYSCSLDPQVKLSRENGELETFASHGDWLDDEIVLDDDNVLVHDVIFSGPARWVIRCNDIVYRWHPFSPSDRGVIKDGTEFSTRY